MFDKYGESAAPCGIDPERVILETHDLTRQYEQSDEVITAVNRVNIRIREGEFVAVVGPGKAPFCTCWQGWTVRVRALFSSGGRTLPRWMTTRWHASGASMSALCFRSTI